MFRTPAVAAQDAVPIAPIRRYFTFSCPSVTGLLVTLCHPGQAFPAATGKVCGARDCVEGAWSRFRQSARRVTSRACPRAAVAVICLPRCARRGQTELMRVVVTLIGPDGTMRRRMVDTVA